MNDEKNNKSKERTRPTFQYEGLTEKQLKAVEMLQSGEFTKGEIAETVGVHRNTITAWCKDDRFKAALKECADEKIRQTLSMLKAKSTRATEILFQLAESSDKRVQMEAVKYILDRNLGKTTSKLQIDENTDNQGTIDIESEIAKIASGELSLDIDYSDE